MQLTTKERKEAKKETLTPYERQAINEGVIVFTDEEKDTLQRLPNKHCESNLKIA